MDSGGKQGDILKRGRGGEKRKTHFLVVGGLLKTTAKHFAQKVRRNTLYRPDNLSRSSLGKLEADFDPQEGLLAEEPGLDLIQEKNYGGGRRYLSDWNMTLEEEERKEKYKISRTLHHGVQAESKDYCALFLVFSMICVFIGLIISCRQVSNLFLNLTYIITDVSALDGQEFMAYIVTVGPIGFDLIRLGLEKGVPLDFMAKYGLSDAVADVADYRDDGDNGENQVLATMDRIDRLLTKSHYKSRYLSGRNADLFFNQRTEVLFSSPINSSMVFLNDVSIRDTLKYVNMLEKTLQTTDYQSTCRTGLSGKEADRRKCPLEEALRYNKLNPLTAYFIASKLC